MTCEAILVEHGANSPPVSMPGTTAQTLYPTTLVGTCRAQP